MLVIVFAHIALNEVKYASQCKTAGRTIRRLFCGFCPGLVPPGWNHSLARRMDFPCAVLWLFSCRQFMAIQAQPWITTGAHALGHIRSAGLGQGAFSPDHCVPLCVVDFHVVRRGPLSLVAGAGLASVSWGDSPAVLVLPLVPDISGKLVLINRRAYSGRSRANRSLHRSISQCPASDVHSHPRLCGGNVPLARFLVRSPFRADSLGHAWEAGNAGGTRAAGGTARLCGLYGTGEIPSYPVYLVAAIWPDSDSIWACGQLPIRFRAYCRQLRP